LGLLRINNKLGTISEVKKNFKRNYSFARYYTETIQGEASYPRERYSNEFLIKNTKSNETVKSKAASSQYEPNEFIARKNNKMHKSFLEGQDIQHEIKPTGSETKYKSQKKIHLGKNQCDFGLSSKVKSKNNLRYGIKNMMQSSPRKNKID